MEVQLEFFISDFDNSLSRAETLDAQVREDAAKISPDGKLFDMISLATRQVFASLEITAPQGQGDEARIFMKDMGMTKSVHMCTCVELCLTLYCTVVSPR